MDRLDIDNLLYSACGTNVDARCDHHHLNLPYKTVCNNMSYCLVEGYHHPIHYPKYPASMPPQTVLYNRVYRPPDPR